MFELILNPYNIAVIVLGGIATWLCNEKYEETKSRPLLNCLPGVFTSLGLLGTFLSICISLNGLGDVNPENIDNTGKTLAEVQVAGGQGLDIMKIISELIPAFTSSIVGLLGALVATVATKLKFAKEDSKLKNLTPEEYIRDIDTNTKSNNDLLKTLIKHNRDIAIYTRDIAIYTKEMTSNNSHLNKHNELLAELIELYKGEEKKNRECNDKLNKNINHQSKILKEFIDGFVNRMDDIFKQMQGAIQQQVQDFGEEQFSKTSQLLTSITERLSNESNEIINTQRVSVETMMNNTNTEISNITTSVTEVLDKLTNVIQSSLSTLHTQQTDRLNTIITNYDSLATKLSEQNTDFANKVTEQMQNEYTKVQEQNVQSLQQMIDLRTAYMKATSEVLTNTLEMNEKATSDLRESMNESMSAFVTNLQGVVSTQVTALGTAINSNVESLNKAYKFIENLVAEIRQNYDQAVLAYGDAVNVAHRTNESSEKAIDANNKSLKAVENTNEKISEILDVLNERQDNIEQLTKQISSVSGAIVELQKLESMLNKITSNK